MQFSLSTEYAIHSLIYLALQPKGKVTLVSKVARAQGVSETYLAKVFQQLAKAGVVISYRGAKGGFALARPPSEISLRQIVAAIEVEAPLFRCLEDRRNCALGDDCEIRSVMNRVEAVMWDMLEQTKLSDLIEGLRPRKEKARWLTQLLAQSQGEKEKN